MKILVPLKQILSPNGITVNRKAGKVFVNKEEYVMNPASKRALEAALRVAETFRHNASSDVAVIAVTLGSARAEDCLREARALGADRAIFVPASRIDSACIVRALVALIQHIGGVNLVINGHRALDTGISSGAGLAEALGWPYLGEAVECSVEQNVVRIIRGRDSETASMAGDCPDRSYEAFETDLPTVVTITRNGPEPRYSHGGNIITMYRDPSAVETLALADLGLTEADLQPVTAERGQSFPPEREFGKQVSVEKIATIIR